MVVASIRAGSTEWDNRVLARTCSEANQNFRSLTGLVDVTEENFRRDKPGHHAHQQKHPLHSATVCGRKGGPFLPSSSPNIGLLDSGLVTSSERLTSRVSMNRLFR
ncbi:hypothetical protein KM043_002086 [Ampulex compressa]|nr:hypothetical protein KM043_002086 [Ampulex compressa]